MFCDVYELYDMDAAIDMYFSSNYLYFTNDSNQDLRHPRLFDNS